MPESVLEVHLVLAGLDVEVAPDPDELDLFEHVLLLERVWLDLLELALRVEVDLDGALLSQADDHHGIDRVKEVFLKK